MSGKSKEKNNNKPSTFLNRGKGGITPKTTKRSKEDSPPTDIPSMKKSKMDELSDKNIDTPKADRLPTEVSDILMEMRSFMVRLDAKQDSLKADLMKSMAEENKKLTDTVGELKSSIEFAHSQIKGITTKCDETNRKIDAGLKLRDENIDSIKRAVVKHKGECEATKSRIEKLEKDNEVIKNDVISVKNVHQETAEFPVKCTLVAQHVPYHEDEDLVKSLNKLIRDKIGCAVKLIRCKRMSVYEDGTGLVKIQLETPEQVQNVLKNKSKLKGCDDPLSSVWLRQSKTKEQMASEQNTNLILRELNIFDRYRRLPNGKLIPKDDNRHGNFRGRSRGGSRGRGRGGARPYSHTQFLTQFQTNYADVLNNKQPIPDRTQRTLNFDRGIMELTPRQTTSVRSQDSKRSPRRSPTSMTGLHSSNGKPPPGSRLNQEQYNDLVNEHLEESARNPWESESSSQEYPRLSHKQHGARNNSH